ncbi:putative arabinan endo-1,5-alpha-L-arabinosidase [Paenibacillus sp. 598K]|uniref:family 43 glycosylhydrolase n=1 Tax=Paenibacillus sp. 598K TaxID=1117987 RepID=UPI000FFA21CF|nr:family 43 glycosylhydrolase [Paenibacillus sp. 598K]GBF72452.1 putative arabinan endo-1,5-alpha-L-arabinosidase [Paenibacillus sp. 598K]
MGKRLRMVLVATILIAIMGCSNEREGEHTMEEIKSAPTLEEGETKRDDAATESTLRIEPQAVSGPDGEIVYGADPKVLRTDDGRYYMYTTMDNGVLPTWTSTNLTDWEPLPSALSADAYHDIGRPDDKTNRKLWLNWAPYVARIGDDYWMFVSSYAGPQLREDGYHLEQSIYAGRSDSPQGPFERFVSVIPRNDARNAPRSYDGPETKASRETHATLKIDAAIFHDPPTDRTYMAYVSYGEQEDPDESGNHIQLFWLNNPAFEEGEGKQPGLYYDYMPDETYPISNPRQWPEFDVPMNRDNNDRPWKPAGEAYGWPAVGVERFVTEAPVLAYIEGKYHFYFSVNTWDSPSYQILQVKADRLRDLDARTRSDSAGNEYAVFQQPERNGDFWSNYGSGSAVQDAEGNWHYMMHSLVKGGGSRFVLHKPIRDE